MPAARAMAVARCRLRGSQEAAGWGVPREVRRGESPHHCSAVRSEGGVRRWAGPDTAPPARRIRKGFPCEARVVARILPQFLDDFFPPQDVMNKVIGEFLSNQQPYPQFMATVVYQVSGGPGGLRGAGRLPGVGGVCGPRAPPLTRGAPLRCSRPCTARGSPPWSGTGSCCPSPTSRRGPRSPWPCGASPASSSARPPALGSQQCILPGGGGRGLGGGARPCPSARCGRGGVSVSPRE